MADVEVTAPRANAIGEPLRTYTLKKGAKFFPGEHGGLVRLEGGAKVQLTMRQAIAFRDKLVESPIVDATGAPIPASEPTDGGNPADSGGGWQASEPGAAQPTGEQTGPHPIHDLNASEAQGLVEGQTSVATLDQLAAAERRNPRHPGGRVSVNRAIEARRAALDR